MKEKVSVAVGNESYLCNLNEGGLYDVILRATNKLDLKDESFKKVFELAFYTRNIQQIYINLIKEQNIMVNNLSVNFWDSTWDFRNHRVEGKVASSYIYHFEKCNLSDYYLILLKLFTLYLISEFGINNGTIKNRFITIRSFFEFICINNIGAIEGIVLRDIDLYLKSKEIDYVTAIKKRKIIQMFFEFYSVLTGYVISDDLRKWFLTVDRDKINATIDENKTPCPPSSFMKRYRDYLWQKALDENEAKMTRGENGLLYLATQSGIRGGELSILRVDDLTIRTMNGKELGILKYRMTKTGNPKGKIYHQNETIANEKFIEMFNYLKDLFSNERQEYETDLLVPNIRSHNNKDNWRVDIFESRLQKRNSINCLLNALEWGLVNCDEAEFFDSIFVCDEENNTRDIPKWVIKESKIEKGQMVSMVTVRQFRVYFASELYERGVDHKTISQLLGHTSVEMWGYYVRSKHPVQDDINYSIGVFQEIIGDDLKILGAKGDAIKNKINSFLLKGGIKVNESLETIIDEICLEMPVKQKLGGFCIKSNPRRECYHDAETDRLLCAYGCCPNHCHLYSSADVSYKKAKDIALLVDYNLQDKGWHNMAQKEASILEIVINQELLPEIEELRDILNKHGRDWVLGRHSNLSHIVDNMDGIYEEIETWRSKILTLNQ